MILLGVDRTKPVGKLVGEYADRQWRYGFLFGFITGSVLCFILKK